MKKLYCFFALFTFISCFAFGQGTSPALQNIVSKLKTFETNYVVEKAYLHFDKPYYSAGDEMYFKAYVTLGEAHTLSKASGIVHVDLINPNNVIIRHILVQLDNGVGPGSFSLPDTLQGGAYRVRAYTRYMTNTPEYFFDKTIPVIAVSGVTGSNPNTTQTAKPDIQFFPEGGELISSLLTKVAFKAIGTNGMGISAKGVVVDNTNLQVATFSSGHLGMGAFYIQPEEG
ncbi:MAG: TonB-dependent receptor, partial [Bacteroidetes bacterium]|nr:TonB-dependent receptor [Bacteroidota bacterium]